jgi:site-specific recombinase XerD
MIAWISATGARIMECGLSASLNRAGVTGHTLRHSFATHLVLREVDVQSLRELLGHSDMRTTMIYIQLARAMRGGNYESFG